MYSKRCPCGSENHTGTRSRAQHQEITLAFSRERPSSEAAARIGIDIGVHCQLTI